MAKSRLSQDDSKFIDDLLNDKQSFFFKGGRKKINVTGGRGTRSWRAGFTISRSFVGVFLFTAKSEYRIGYTRGAR